MNIIINYHDIDKNDEIIDFFIIAIYVSYGKLIAIIIIIKLYAMTRISNAKGV